MEPINRDKSIKILVADDDEIVCTGIKRILEIDRSLQKVFQVEIESKLVERVGTRVSQLDYDILILDLDWHADQEAGLHILRKLRKAYPDLCIITMSNWPDLIKESRSAGATFARPKGFDRTALIDLIEQALTEINRNGYFK
jgi:DNA-binding NarL/FixJ family response regulator